MNLQPNEILRVRPDGEGRVKFDLRGYFPKGTVVNEEGRPPEEYQRLRMEFYTLQHSVTPANKDQFLVIEVECIVGSLLETAAKFKREHFGCE